MVSRKQDTSKNRRRSETVPSNKLDQMIEEAIVDAYGDSEQTTGFYTINSIMTATYWAIGRRIVEEGLGGRARAEYGEELIARLSRDLTARFGKGFGAVKPKPDETLLHPLASRSNSSDAVRKMLWSNSSDSV
jgi:hypothetical protein